MKFSSKEALHMNKPEMKSKCLENFYV